MTHNQQRIFWLGMHVVLTRTELPRLRELGFEVFNPPYNSKVYDQSANLNWDKDQPTTLPPEVFKELSQYNFFYNRISSRIAHLLNKYFSTVIVTINPDWFQEILKVYHGRLIYRVYGQVGTISDALWARRCFRAIQERDDFWIVPHAEEAVSEEHAWLKERLRVVPYTLASDVYDHQDTWSLQEEHEPEIMVSCPNIDNPYYANYYNYLTHYFNQPYIKIYGVQPRQVRDRRVVGTIPRLELLNAYKKSAGYFYPYEERNVCYLPPIEMMTVGGPVIYPSNSLLAKYFGSQSPGFALDVYEAKRKLKWLLDGDRAFAEDVIASQEQVRLKYAPEYANPIFDETFKALLSGEISAPAHPVVINSQEKAPATKRVYVLFHFPGNIVQFQNGQYLSAEGIPRVVRKFIEAVLAKTDYQVVITCYAEQLQFAFGFFSANHYLDKVKFLVLDQENLNFADQLSIRKILSEGLKTYKTFKDNLDKSVQPLYSWLRKSLLLLGNQLIITTDKTKILLQSAKFAVSLGKVLFFCLLPLIPLLLLGLKVTKQLREAIKATISTSLDRLRRVNNKLLRLEKRPEYVMHINEDSDASCVVVPHYYLFSESIFLQQNTLLYLPDYTPHFFTESFDGNRDNINAVIGKIIAQRAQAVFTNSFFTKSYLPDTLLSVNSSKIQVLPIPLLMQESQPLDLILKVKLEKLLAESPYIFYPTQNRPNKQIRFLFEVFEQVQAELEDLKLVLTCNLGDYGPAAGAYHGLGLGESVIFLNGVSDPELSWLYTHALALCLTSTMEGNFPPQVFEALSLDTPVVASRLPLITELLGDSAENLLLCEPLDLEDFKKNLLYAIANPDQVRERQRLAYNSILERCSDEKFNQSVADLLANVIS